MRKSLEHSLLQILQNKIKFLYLVSSIKNESTNHFWTQGESRRFRRIRRQKPFNDSKFPTFQTFHIDCHRAASQPIYKYEGIQICRIVLKFNLNLRKCLNSEFFRNGLNVVIKICWRLCHRQSNFAQLSYKLTVRNCSQMYENFADTADYLWNLYKYAQNLAH